MVSGLIQPNSKGGVHTEVIRTKPLKKSGQKNYLSKKTEGLGGGGSPRLFKKTQDASCLA